MRNRKWQLTLLETTNNVFQEINREGFEGRKIGGCIHRQEVEDLSLALILGSECLRVDLGQV